MEEISNSSNVPSQRKDAEGDFWPTSDQLLVGPKTLAESLDDDFVEVCDHVSAGQYLAAITVAAWSEYRVEQQESLTNAPSELGIRERAAGTVALALEFYHMHQDLPDHPMLRNHLLAA